MSEAEEFATLFAGRLDAYGTEEGGCDRPSQILHREYERRIEAHLDGSRPMGVYPMFQEGDRWCVNWGCVDFDEGDEESLVHANNLRIGLKAIGMTGWIERSRSKGYHVWLFSDGKVDAHLMRSALLGLCQIVGAPTKEINPKQNELAEGQVGNYVRLPYPGGDAAPGTRRKVIDPHTQMALPLGGFLRRAAQGKVTADQLAVAASLYTPPAPPPRQSVPASCMVGDPVARLAGKTLIIWRDGPLEGMDRSGTLWKLARLLYTDGRHTESEAVDLLADANQRWGKPDYGANVIPNMVRKAWST
jgi:hypothetical protein